jgi:hypothetical protein
MRADNTAHLITAAQQRHELTRAKAIRALHELDQSGAPTTFDTVAHQAQVSRSWLYTQPDIKAEIQRLRALDHRTPHTPVPSRQRTTEASLLHRLEVANNRNRELTEENHHLRRQLERALGQLRTPVHRQPADRHAHPTCPSPFHNDHTPPTMSDQPHAATSRTPPSTQPPRPQP